ncbi:hypothetical protein [Virgibacillus proomii]|jgi:hypothetical protein|uniref:hypothetical protein n=1 Tax=Virgibacillus proomii TaxID=84407 RepID=UPI0009867217|nr:hypothetical protein [Virgibacillus proomii]
MKGLEDVQEVRAYFFGNEMQKKQVYEQFVIPYFQKANIPFHAERDWYGGPNYRVVTKDNNLDISLFKKSFVNYCYEQFGVLNKAKLQENVKTYVKNTATVSQMERRENKAISIEHHLQVEYDLIDKNYVKKRFNSFHHFRIHTELLFIMQKFINNHIHVLSSLSKEKQMEYMTRASKQTIHIIDNRLIDYHLIDILHFKEVVGNEITLHYGFYAKKFIVGPLIVNEASYGYDSFKQVFQSPISLPAVPQSLIVAGLVNRTLYFIMKNTLKYLADDAQLPINQVFAFHNYSFNSEVMDIEVESDTNRKGVLR